MSRPRRSHRRAARPPTNAPGERETRLIPHRRGGSLRVACCYPNSYHVGMSSLGFHTILRLFTDHPDVACERVFLPTARHSPRGGLRSLESGLDLRRFDLLAFSLSFESDALNVLRILRESGMPLRAAERSATDPLVIIGGVMPGINPEPLAPFADVIAVGEGEVLVPRLLEAVADNPGGKAAALAALTPAEGFYVPERLRPRFSVQGGFEGYDGADRVVRQRGRADSLPLPQSAILTPDTELGFKHLVEVTRGCPCLCRFCWAGYNYLPFRAFSREQLVAAARGARPFTNRIGLVSAALCAHPELDALLDDLLGLDYEVAAASLRLDDLTENVLAKLVVAGGQGVTLAPECGSDSLRRRLNKPYTNAEILDRAGWVFEQGVLNLKLYFMVGLPYESEEDVAAIVTLAADIHRRMLQVGRGLGRVGRLQLSINPFVPKPGTPFQWSPMARPRELTRKLRWLSRALRTLANVECATASVREMTEQALIARGDRRLADVLEAALGRECSLEQALRQGNLDADVLLYRARERSEPLPWAVVDNGVRAGFLEQEYANAAQATVSRECPGVPGCGRCGVCGPDALRGAS
jgi:radical SAM superfamily enzyme YgiQ (UPF0313 family)